MFLGCGQPLDQRQDAAPLVLCQPLEFGSCGPDVDQKLVAGTPFATSDWTLAVGGSPVLQPLHIKTLPLGRRHRNLANRLAPHLRHLAPLISSVTRKGNIFVSNESQGEVVATCGADRVETASYRH